MHTHLCTHTRPHIYDSWGNLNTDSIPDDTKGLFII